MITAQRMIAAFAPKMQPIKLAAAWYLKWDSQIKFIDDLDDYLLTGIVISTPYLFGMAKVIQVDNQVPAWFVRIAVGRLDTLLAALPCYLPKICFCRRNDGRLRVYDTARLMKLAGKMAIAGKGEL